MRKRGSFLFVFIVLLFLESTGQDTTINMIPEEFPDDYQPNEHIIRNKIRKRIKYSFKDSADQRIFKRSGYEEYDIYGRISCINESVTFLDPQNPAPVNKTSKFDWLNDSTVVVKTYYPNSYRFRRYTESFDGDTGMYTGDSTLLAHDFDGKSYYTIAHIHLDQEMKLKYFSSLDAEGRGISTLKAPNWKIDESKFKQRCDSMYLNNKLHKVVCEFPFKYAIGGEGITLSILKFDSLERCTQVLRLFDINKNVLDTGRTIVTYRKESKNIYKSYGLSKSGDMYHINTYYYDNNDSLIHHTFRNKGSEKFFKTEIIYEGNKKILFSRFMRGDFLVSWRYEIVDDLLIRFYSNEGKCGYEYRIVN